MSTIRTNAQPTPLSDVPRVDARQQPPVAVANTVVPEQAALGADAPVVAGVPQDKGLQDAHQQVSSQLASPAGLSSDDLQRLLKSPTQRRQISRVLQQAPALKQAFLQREGGAEVLNLLQQRTLSSAQTRQIQSFLAQHSGASLAYPGHATGIDGQYGTRTQQALLSFLTQALDQPAAATPATPEAPARTGPGAVLNTLSASQRQQLQAQAPEVYALLQKGPLTATENRQLQQALVDAGHDLSYPGHPTGVDGDFGPRSRAALASWAQQHSQVAEEPATPAQPTQPTTPPAEPEAPVAPPAAKPSLSAETPLNRLAQQVLDLPADTQAKLPTALQEALRQVAGGDTSKPTAKALQQALVDMGQKLNYPGHATGVDGQPGQRTRQALVNVVESAITGKAAAVQKSGPFPHYDRMLDDNLLDMTLAIGYDEGTDVYASAHTFEQRKMLDALADRGFVRDDAKALALLKAAGQDLQADYTALYVKENVSEKDGKPVHAIVRVIHAGDGTQGAEKRAAAIEAMNQSDVFMYGGHARYGTGMDFDRNFTVTIDWNGVPNAPAQGKVTYKDYGALKDLLGGNAEANQWLATLDKQGKISVEGSNDGNIRMSEKDMHRAEFGSRLMNKALEGVDNTLSEEIQGDRYRLWLFNGCRTVDYMPSIQAESRENPLLGSKNLDVMTTEQTLYWHNISNSLMQFLDGVMAQDGTPDLLGRMTGANPEQADHATHSVHGFADNPKQ